MNFFKGLVDMLANLNEVGLAIVFLTLAVFVFSFVVNFAVRRSYTKMQDDLENDENQKSEKFKTELLNKIVESYKNTALVNYNEVNTQAIIENWFNARLRVLLVSERFVKHTVSILITLGLLGTFLGLTLSVSQLARVFDDIKDANSFSKDLISLLIPSVYGMAVAFITSLVGIACSLVFSVATTIYSAEEARESLMVRLEEYLDNTVSLSIAKDKETEYTIMNKILRETFVEFGEKIENTLRNTVETFGDKLSRVVMEVNLSSKVLDSTVEKFDQSLQNFAGNIKDFTEFNNNLRNNIEKMDVSFIKVTEALADTSKVVVENYNGIENFTKDIRHAAEEITDYNKRVVEDIGSLVGEVKTTVSSIKELGEVIRNDLVSRTEDIKEYQDKFNNLMQKLSDEISLLGKNTAEAFSASLDESGKTVAQKVVQSMQDVMKEILEILDDFKENEKMLAKTIVMLPDQVLTYNETASAQVGKQLDEVKRLFRNMNG